MDPMAQYFEPASRLQLASKLRHLLRFSDLMLVLVGVEDSGRSTLLSQLAGSDSQVDIRQALLQCEETVDVTRLLKLLVSTLSLDCPDSADNRIRLKALHTYSRTLHESGTPLVLLIDDADYLTNNALELLINFAMLGEGGPRVVLTGTPDFEQRFIANEFDQMVDGRLHVQLLGAFEPEESREFAESLLPAGTQLPARRMRRLIEESGGLPGRLYVAVANQMRGGGVVRSRARAFPLPSLHLSAIALILLAILGASVWLYLPEREGTVEEETTRIVMPIDIPAANTGAEAEVIEVRSELEQKLAEQERKLGSTSGVEAPEPSEQAAPGMTESVNPVVEPSVTQTDLAPPEKPAAIPAATPEPVAQADQKLQSQAGQSSSAERASGGTAQAEAEPAAVAAVSKQVSPPAQQKTAARGNGSDSPLLRADELLQWPDKGYTLQMLGAREIASVERFVSAQSNPERFYYFKTVYKGAPWHVVVYGQFPDRASAMAAVQTLPAELRKLRPWARSIAGVKSDIRK